MAAVPHRAGDDFLRRGHPRQDLADAILAKRAHSKLTGSVAQLQCGGIVVDHLASMFEMQEAIAAILCVLSCIDPLESLT